MTTTRSPADSERQPVEPQKPRARSLRRMLLVSLLVASASCAPGARDDDLVSGGGSDAGAYDGGSGFGTFSVVATLPGHDVVITSDAIYTLQESSWFCPPDGPPCGGGGPGTLQPNADGAITRIGRDLTGTPTPINSNLYVRNGRLAIVGQFAIVVENDHDAYSVSLATGSTKALTDLGTRGGGTPYGADSSAVYVEANDADVDHFQRITPSAANLFTVTEPPGYGTNPFFSVADGFIYFPLDCADNCDGACGTLVSPCSRSGIGRASLTDGAIAPFVTVGAAVDFAAARGSDVYFAVGGSIRHYEIGSSAPPVEIRVDNVGRTGLTPVEDGVLINSSKGLLFVSRDGATTQLLFETPLGCSIAKSDGDLVACAGGAVYIARRQ